MVDTQTPPPSSRGGGTFLLDFFRTRPWAKRAVSVLSALLLIAGQFDLSVGSLFGF